MPLTDRAEVFGGPRFRNRLDDDDRSRVSEYRGAFGRTLRELGKTGPFWVRP